MACFAALAFIGLHVISLALETAISTFEICQTINTVVRRASIMLTSTEHHRTTNVSTNGQHICECIIQTVDKADIYMDFLHSQLDSKSDQCQYEYVLLENKRNINQSVADKILKVCGESHLEGRWFQDAIRITYVSGNSMQTQGLRAQFTVNNPGKEPMIELDCGKVNNTKLQELFQRQAEPKQQHQQYPKVPSARFGSPDMSLMLSGFGRTGYLPPWPPFLPSGVPVISKHIPDFFRWKQNLDVPTQNIGGSNSEITIPRNLFNLQTINTNFVPYPYMPAMFIPTENLDKNEQNITQHPSLKSNENRTTFHAKTNVVERGSNDRIDRPMEEQLIPKISTTDKSSMAAVVVSGIGGVLILGCVGMCIIHYYRKQKQQKKAKAEYYYHDNAARCIYGQGWELNDMETEYATISDVQNSCFLGMTNMNGTDSHMRYIDSSLKCTEASNSLSKGSVHNNQKEKQDNCDTISHALSREEHIPADCTAKLNNRQCEIAVIEVHQDAESEIFNGLHEVDCLSTSKYETANNAYPVNHCNECNRVRSTKWTDYDNNLSVKLKQY